MEQVRCFTSEDGTKRWYKGDKLHREDGPALEDANGDNWWYKDDELHREDGPAIEDADGHKAWYINGQCHRVDGPAEWEGGAVPVGWARDGWYIDDKPLGFGPKGFWALWDRLTPEQRANPNLLRWLPR